MPTPNILMHHVLTGGSGGALKSLNGGDPVLGPCRIKSEKRRNDDCNSKCAAGRRRMSCVAGGRGAKRRKSQEAGGSKQKRSKP